MATYKLIQDIEAEDHILGPLTLRQFIYALVAVGCFYMTFVFYVKVAHVLAAIFVPPGLFCLFFAIPFGTQQSTEVWALAKIRFYLKPRRRIWDQSGMKELVTITAPKKVAVQRTDGLSQTEVRSRLQALANTIDSRGWAVKNVNINAYAQPDPVAAMDSDRLVGMSNLPQSGLAADVQAQDDMLDETSNPIAKQFEQMITKSEQDHRSSLVQQMKQPAGQTGQPQQPPADYWFMGQPGQPAHDKADDTVFTSQAVVAPGAPEEHVSKQERAAEAELAAELKAHKKHDPSSAAYSHMHTLQPTQHDDAAAQTTPPPAMTPPPDPAILALANNDDLNVATIARQAHKAKGEDLGDNEVVISLH